MKLLVFAGIAAAVVVVVVVAAVAVAGATACAPVDVVDDNIFEITKNNT